MVVAPSAAEAAREEAATGQARVAKEQRFAEASRVAEAARAEAAERGAEDARLEHSMQQAAEAAAAWAARVQSSEQNAAAAKAAAESATQAETEAAQAGKVAKQKAPRAPKGGGGGGGGGELPPGWSQAADPQTGAAYYVNAATNETVWERPAAPAPVVTKLKVAPPKDETEEERTARELGIATTPLDAAQAIRRSANPNLNPNPNPSPNPNPNPSPEPNPNPNPNPTPTPNQVRLANMPTEGGGLRLHKLGVPGQGQTGTGEDACGSVGDVLSSKWCHHLPTYLPYRSTLTAYYSPLTTWYLLLTAHCSLLTTTYQVGDVYRDLNKIMGGKLVGVGAKQEAERFQP